MPPQRIYLLRHGQSTFNASWDARGIDPGDIDAPLTALGHEQVSGVRSHVEALQVDLVVTSPATRALQTTLGLFAGAVAPPIIVEARVRDRFSGDSCDYGRAPVTLAAEFQGLDFGHLPERWWHPAADIPGAAVESRDAFANRVDRLRAWLLARTERSVLVVGHEGTFRQLAGVRMANVQMIEWGWAESMSAGRV